MSRPWLPFALLLATAVAPLQAGAAPPAPAAAEAARPSRTITKKEKRRYRAALRAGRAKVKKGNYKGAVADFEAALVAIPDDARALSELGWAAFKAGDRAKARRATERSIAAAGDAKLRAASLYNLGRILEDEGQKARAIDAYERSLALRPNATVRDRLVSLDPSATPEQAIAPEALEGPFASIAAYCKAFVAAEEDPETPCNADGPDVPTLPAVTLEKPYRAVVVFLAGRDEDCSLGVRTAAGWYVQPAFLPCRLMGGRWDRLVTFESVTLRDVVPGGAKELLVEVRTDESYNDTPPDAADDEMVITTSSARTLSICGVGASGVPSCTPAFLTAMSQDEAPGYVLEPRFEGGALVLRLKEGGAKADEAAAALIGTHPLVFP